MPTLIVIAAVLAPPGYLLHCRIWPYTRCSRCDGTGRRNGSNRDRWGACKKCGGSGRQERLGCRFIRRKDT